ncbi:MAG: hypothetical protein ACJAX7_002512, partial [Saprospiraceae bacterium]
NTVYNQLLWQVHIWKIPSEFSRVRFCLLN